MQFIEQISSGNSQLFQTLFVEQDRPCVLKNLASQWRAYTTWTPEYLSKNHGEVLLPISNYPGQGNPKMSEKPRMPLREYMAFVEKAVKGVPEAQQPLYAAGWHYLKDCPALARDLSCPSEFENNWIDRLQGIINFDQTSLFIGHPAAETPLHTDSFFVSTWLVMISGSKRVRLIPGSYAGYVKNGLDTFSDSVLIELERRHIPVFEAEIGPGDALFIPPGWWHQVRNLSATIAVSNNFVSRSHFLAFEQQLRAKLLKPILGLSKLRQEATESGAQIGHETLMSSRYLENERAYIGFLQSEVQTLTKVTTQVEAAC
jgi:hypothetical protein